MDMYQIDNMHRENKRLANLSKLDSERSQKEKNEFRKNLVDDVSEASQIQLPLV